MQRFNPMNAMAMMARRAPAQQENAMRAFAPPGANPSAPRPDIYPIPPHAPEQAPFDQGIYRQPVAPGTQNLGFDNNGLTEEEWFRLVYPALRGRQRIDL